MMEAWNMLDECTYGGLVNETYASSSAQEMTIGKTKRVQE